MEQLKNSECWYKDTCVEDCDNCVVYIQLKWQMDNSGLFKSQQRPITLYIDSANEVDRVAYKRLASIRAGIEQYVDEHKNLYIASENTGNGKTSWAIKMLQTYFHYTANGNYEHLKGMFVSVTDLLLRLKDFNNPISPEYKKQLETVDLVVFDDIAVTGISQYDYTQLFNIINNRISAEKSNIFTSNVVKLNQLEKILGARLASRIYNASEIIELKGRDRRDGSITDLV